MSNDTLLSADASIPFTGRGKEGTINFNVGLFLHTYIFLVNKVIYYELLLHITIF